MKKEIYQLFCSVVSGNLQHLIDNINEKNVNYIDPDTELTLMMVAVSLERLPTIELLLNRHACISIKDKKGWNILHRAVWSGNVETVNAILFTNYYRKIEEKGNKISITHKEQYANFKYNEKEQNYITQLKTENKNTGNEEYVGEQRHDSIGVEKIWRRDAERLLSEKHHITKLTPIMLAVIKGDTAMVKYLIKECKGHPVKTFWEILTLLNLASITGHAGVAKVIIEHIIKEDTTEINKIETIQHKLEQYAFNAETQQRRNKLEQIRQMISEYFFAPSTQYV